MTHLQGKVVAVTGGARGIGEATARALAARGATVAIGDLDAELAQRSAGGCGGLGLPLDVTSRDSFAGFLDKIEAEFGRVDGLVNNAGIMVIGRHLETSLDKQLAQLDVNLRGVVIGCHEAARRMVAAGGGTIVNIASLAGPIPTPGSAVYSGTKAAVVSMSEALDAELKEAGVRVSAVLPSFTNTALIDGTTAPRLSPPIEPEEVADAVAGLFEKHRARVVVPRSAVVGLALKAVVPARGQDWLGRTTGTSTMFTEYDHGARAAYDQRVDSVAETSESTRPA